MPIYDYQCPHCHKRAEDVARSVADRDDGPVCCGEKMKRDVSGAAFVLKGTGWERDGYGGER